MSDYDNGFKRAQQMYDAQEPPEDDEPEETQRCPKCGAEMVDESGIDDNLKLVVDFYCADCDLYLSDCPVLTGEEKVK